MLLFRRNRMPARVYTLLQLSERYLFFCFLHAPFVYNQPSGLVAEHLGQVRVQRYPERISNLLLHAAPDLLTSWTLYRTSE